MSQKQPKPTLTGQRIRTRKRDEKEKYEPLLFRDAIIAGVNECDRDLEQLSRFLDTAGGTLNYRRYAEVLFDILFAGGMLAPGGTIVEDAEPGKAFKTELCVFGTALDREAMKSFIQVFPLLMRRYKYLQMSYEEELQKILKFLKGFSEQERAKLAMAVGLLLAQGLAPASVLNSLLNEHLVKEGLSLQFITDLFLAFLALKDINSLASVLRKGGFSGKLMEVFPVSKRTQDHFEQHFKEASLSPLVDLWRSHQAAGSKKVVESEVAEMFQRELEVAEMLTLCQELQKKHSLSDADMLTLAWKAMMGAVEWNKKEDILADQAMRHLKKYASFLASFSTSPRSELVFLVKVQEFCYDQVNFMKLFQKMILLFYKADVVSEEVVLKWYKDGHSSKGKSAFLSQMQPMIEWLQSAEEESSEED